MLDVVPPGPQVCLDQILYRRPGLIHLRTRCAVAVCVVEEEDVLTCTWSHASAELGTSLGSCPDLHRWWPTTHTHTHTRRHTHRCMRGVNLVCASPPAAETTQLKARSICLHYESLLAISSVRRGGWTEGKHLILPVSLQLQPADVQTEQLEPWKLLHKERITRRKRRLTGMLVKSSLIEWLVRFKCCNCCAAGFHYCHCTECWLKPFHHSVAAAVKAPPAGCTEHHTSPDAHPSVFRPEQVS